MDISAFFLDCGTRKIFWKEEEEEASVLRGTITHPKKEEGKMLVFQASYRRRNELHATSWLIVFVFTSTIQSGEIALSVSRVFVYNGDGSFCMLSCLWKTALQICKDTDTGYLVATNERGISNSRVHVVRPQPRACKALVLFLFFPFGLRSATR